VAFIVLAIVMVASKVYSPQYVLWLTPLAVIALTHKKDLHAFWIWQIAETMYHVAIWQHLALFTGAAFGLQEGGYATITLIRIAATIYLAWTLIKRALAARNTQGSLFDLLFEGSKAYP
jgi:lipoprotein signal peptidase